MQIEKLLKDRACLKIARFFHENPASIDTPRGIATWTNVDRKKASDALKKLAEAGVLAAHKVSSTTGYSYTRNKSIVAKIARCLKG